MYYIGVDLGTSAVKLLLMEESGKICNIVSKEYPLFFPHPGWSEQNPEDWFTQSVEGMKELTEGIDRSQVAGIGFGGQMHGLVTLDKDDNVIRPAILWNDGRSQKETDNRWKCCLTFMVSIQSTELTCNFYVVRFFLQKLRHVRQGCPARQQIQLPNGLR